MVLSKSLLMRSLQKHKTTLQGCQAVGTLPVSLLVFAVSTCLADSFSGRLIVSTAMNIKIYYTPQTTYFAATLVSISVIIAIALYISCCNRKKC